MNAAGDDRSRLLRALALSQRFHLYLAYCASPRAADQLLRAVEDELPRLRGAPVELVRLDPYEGRESDAPLDERELANRILIPLLSPPEELKAHGIIHVLDASRAAHADSEAWGKLFALWNEKRNALQQLGGEVLVLLPESFKRLFTKWAPDVWSIRSDEYTIEETSALEAISRGAVPGQRQLALDWYRAIPPLALFGGDILVRPWLDDIVHSADVDDIVAEPAVRGGDVSDERAVAQRQLRRAEHALGQRRFSDAEQMLRQVLENPGKSFAIRRRAVTALIVALSAEDQAEQALALDDLTGVNRWGPPRAMGAKVHPLRRAAAYAHWCAGPFHVADLIAPAIAGGERNAGIRWDQLADDRSAALRWEERGQIEIAKQFLAILPVDADDPMSNEVRDNQLIHIDAYFLTGNLERAAALLAPSFAEAETDGLDDEIAAELRFDTLRTLVDLARGNLDSAARVLSRPRPEIKRTKEPEVLDRVYAFHAFASGLLQADRQNPEGAIEWFARARTHIAAWSQTGLDRRSLHRASLAVDLAHATLDPAPDDPVRVARQLVGRGVRLLGDTAEDFIARVLAVEAHRELTRRLADSGDSKAIVEAHVAFETAGPLAGRGAPAWDMLLAATEREALSFVTLPLPFRNR